jgi:hypothetical protein
MSSPLQFTPEQVKPLLDPLVAKINERSKRLADELAADRADKTNANALCLMAGLPGMYKLDGGADGQIAPSSQALKFKTDDFVGVGLSEAVAKYLEARKASGTMEGPATLDEIYEALLSGGFKFGGTTDNPSNHKRAMNIALTRNTAQIHKINENTFALRRWYGMRSPRKMAPALTAGRTGTLVPPPAEVMDLDEEPTPSAPTGAASQP